jgi:hypothetical protein
MRRQKAAELHSTKTSIKVAADCKERHMTHESRMADLLRKAFPETNYSVLITEAVIAFGLLTIAMALLATL